jgi:hypothetical protein
MKNYEILNLVINSMSNINGFKTSNLLVLAFTFFFLDCQQNKAPEVEIRSIYGNPILFWDRGINHRSQMTIVS